MNNKRCLFKEEISSKYIRFRSEANRKWMIGFRESGKTIPAFRNSKKFYRKWRKLRRKLKRAKSISHSRKTIQRIRALRKLTRWRSRHKLCRRTTTFRFAQEIVDKTNDDNIGPRVSWPTIR